MKKVFVLLFAVILFGCENAAIEVEHKGEFKLELLFEKDGCKVYRFEDGGRNVYWSNCEGKTEGAYSTGNGKTTVTHSQESITVK